MDMSKLHAYQRYCEEHIVKNEYCGLFLDMGLGKTVTTLTALLQLVDTGAVRHVLVVAPKRVAETVWAAEAEKWQHLQRLKVVKVVGDMRQRLDALKRPAHVFVIGRDNLAWLCKVYDYALPFDMFVVDESSGFKSVGSLRFKSLRRALNSFNRGVILTGTPAPNSLEDLWAQIYLLDKGKRLGTTLSYYRSMYFQPDKVGGGFVVYSYKLKRGADAEIHARIKDICISMRAQDYLSLPERVINVVNVDMGSNLNKQYRLFEMERIMEVLGDNTQVTAAHAGVLCNKLLQFANGAIYDEEGGIHEVHNHKLEAVEEIINGSGGRNIMIAYNFKHDLARLMQHLKGYSPRTLMKPSDVADWNNGKIRVLLCHPAAVGHGLNLQSGGNTLVWFGQTWSLELYEQLNARLHRQGQKERVIIHHIIAKDTIDEDVLKSLSKKERGQSQLLESVRKKMADLCHASP